MGNESQAIGELPSGRSVFSHSSLFSIVISPTLPLRWGNSSSQGAGLILELRFSSALDSVTPILEPGGGHLQPP
jgi:hypothetical protein